MRLFLFLLEGSGSTSKLVARRQPASGHKVREATVRNKTQERRAGALGWETEGGGLRPSAARGFLAFHSVTPPRRLRGAVVRRAGRSVPFH